MDTRPRPPILDMTPEGEFRDPPGPPRATWLDRALGRVGGVALLVALGALGLLVAAVAVVFVSLLIPVVLVAGAVGFGTLWWRLRRGRGPGGPVRFVVVRR